MYTEEYIRNIVLEKAHADPEYEQAKQRWLNGETLTAICKDTKMCRHTLSNYLKAEGYEIKSGSSKYNYNVNVFESIDTERKAYWLGFLYADGYIRYGDSWGGHLTLQEKDRNDLQDFADLVGAPIHTEYSKFKGKEYPVARVSFTNKQMVQNLVFKGCVPNKSQTITWPDETILPYEYSLDFLRGYFDGNGSIISVDKGKKIGISLSCASKLFVDSFIYILYLHGVNVGETKILNSGRVKQGYQPIYGFNKSAKDIVVSFYEKVYKGKRNLSLKRKYDKIATYCRSKTSTAEVLE